MEKSSRTLTFGRLQGFTSSDRLLVLLSVSSALIYFVTHDYQPYPGSTIIKGLCVAPLALLTIRRLRNRDGIVLGISLLFSSAGDVFLALDPEDLFVFGLASFLIAHLLYISLFLRNLRRPLFTGARQTLLIPSLMIYSVAMTVWLWPSLGSLAGPVTAYICVITAMAVSATLAGFKTPWVVIGALLFILSDSLIAVTKFRGSIVYSDYIIWFTYFTAQYCIVFGFLGEKPGSE